MADETTPEVKKPGTDFTDAVKQLIDDETPAAPSEGADTGQAPPADPAAADPPAVDDQPPVEDKGDPSPTEYWQSKIEADKAARAEKKRLQDESLAELLKLPVDERLKAAGVSIDEALDTFVGGVPAGESVAPAAEGVVDPQVAEVLHLVKQQQQQIEALVEETKKTKKKTRVHEALEVAADKEAYEVVRDVYGEYGADLAVDLQEHLSNRAGERVPLTDALSMVEEKLRGIEEDRLSKMEKTAWFKKWAANRGYSKQDSADDEVKVTPGTTDQVKVTPTLPPGTGDTASPRTLTDLESLTESAKLLKIG